MINMLLTIIMARKTINLVAGYIETIICIVTDYIGSIYPETVLLAVGRLVVMTGGTPVLLPWFEGTNIDATIPVVLGHLNPIKGTSLAVAVVADRSGS